MRATRRHSILTTMCKGMNFCTSMRLIKIISKIFGRFEAKIKFRRLLVATAGALLNLGYNSISEADLSFYCRNLEADGIITRSYEHTVLDWNNPTTWVISSPLVSHCGSILGRIHDPWKHISYEMDPLHRLAAAL